MLTVAIMTLKAADTLNVCISTPSGRILANETIKRDNAVSVSSHKTFDNTNVILVTITCIIFIIVLLHDDDARIRVGVLLQ